MEEVILAQMLEKKTPKLKQKVEVKAKKPSAQLQQSVSMSIPIVDKRPTSAFDRKSLLSKLSSKIGVKSIIPITIIKEEEEVFEKKEVVKDEIEAITKSETPLDKILEEYVIVEGDDPNEILPKLILVSASPKDDIPQLEKTVTARTKRTVAEPIIISPEDIVDMPSQFIKKIPEKTPNILIKSSAYYMNNRQIFIDFIYNLLEPYQKELKDDYSCDNKNTTDFNLFAHQKIVRDYINLITPYRGLLLYHGLGSGKTCSSIGIAEGLKTDKQVLIMTPASLATNYMEELKKCGDLLYKKNQYWKFISVETNPELIEPLSAVLRIPTKKIKTNKGAWFVNINNQPNYDTLTGPQQYSLNIQLEDMIRSKYQFIHYNGINKAGISNLTQNNTINPFNNKVVIIDEAHNFVSRIVNKLRNSDPRVGKDGKTTEKMGWPIALRLYDALMTAENAKIILLTGTPIINLPNEIAISMNILRGLIKTFEFKLVIAGNESVTQEYLIKLFKSTPILKDLFDYVEYKPKTSMLTITRNPYGFYSTINNAEYMGVTLVKDGNIDDNTFVQVITMILNEKDIKILNSNVEGYPCLPDTFDSFSHYFIDADSNKVKNMNLFKRRILGLVSYFPDIDALLPRYDKQDPEDFSVIKIDMSDFQFGVYEQARVEERKVESNNAKKKRAAAGEGVYEESTSTYRIFSRAFCNYVFPKEKDAGIYRPMPRGDKEEVSADIIETANEDILDAISEEEKLKDTEGKYDVEETEKQPSPEAAKENKSYEMRVKDVLMELEKHKEKYLSPKALETYSPKFLNILSSILDEENIGLHLVYSQFRTLEGIGILALVLKANGFAQFKITKKGGEWKLDIPIEDKGKPMFVLYTGTECRDEKEIVRNIFNSNWSVIPVDLRKQLEEIYPDKEKMNLYGDIIKVIMITASGAEGISLSNVRFVLITEPYWHPVRIDQVIGRARRICSHQNLPTELQTVQVFLYLMKFSEKQITSGDAKELVKHDKGKLLVNGKYPVLTSDEALYEIAIIKENLNKEVIKNIKEAAIDCNIHSKLGSREKLQCFTFGDNNPDKFSYTPAISTDDQDSSSDINMTVIKTKPKLIPIQGIERIYDPATGKVYNKESFLKKAPVQVGWIEKKAGKTVYTPLIKK